MVEIGKWHPYVAICPYCGYDRPITDYGLTHDELDLGDCEVVCPKCNNAILISERVTHEYRVMKVD